VISTQRTTSRFASIKLGGKIIVLHNALFSVSYSSWDNKEFLDRILRDLGEMMWKVVDFMRLAENRDQWPCAHGNKPSGSVNGGKFLN
jgi:hypothetical protein